MRAPLGVHFEREIREQPAVWRRLAARDDAAGLADELRRGDVVFVGSGSSLFAARLGTLALRRRGIRAVALAATEVRFEAQAFRGCRVVALSQSGRSSDVLEALDRLEPASLIALTNAPDSPLAARADRVFELDAGPELAVPATKTVTAMAALLLWAAGLTGGRSEREAATLRATADAVERWLDGPEVAALEFAARQLARARSVVLLGSGYGVPVAAEAALKLKEASYVHAEGFPAGEFRHGSAALLDGQSALIGIVDRASHELVARPLREAAGTGARRYSLGGDVAGLERLGPLVGEPFNTLAWLVAGQLLALYAGRERGVDGDAPRAISKFISERSLEGPASPHGQ